MSASCPAQPHPRHNLTQWLVNTMLTCCLFSLFTPMASANLSDEAQLKQHRDLYQQARKALQAQQYQQFNALTMQLKDYSLYPYLRYEQLRRNLGSLSQAEFDQFAERYNDTPVVRRLQISWIRHLAREEQWQQFLTNFPDHTNSASLNCQKGWALHKTGDKAQAMATAEELWLAPRSQPKICDRLFAVWMQEAGVSEDLAWQRFWMALLNSQSGLANYLTRFLKSTDKQQQAQIALKLFHNPEGLQTTSLASKDPHFSQFTALLIKRTIRKNPALAVDLWQQYADQLELADNTKANLKRRLGLYVLKSYHPESAQWLERLDPLFEDEKLLEWRLRYQLSHENWNEVGRLLAKLPDSLRQKNRWRYWQARHLDLQGSHSEANSLYKGLSYERDFYGFLAAQQLGSGFKLNHTPKTIDPATLETLEAIPGIQRAREFYYHQQRSDARIEWWRATQHLSKNQHYHAGILAQRWGWLSQGIFGAINARHWDDLELRFPAPYKQKISDRAAKYNIDDQWIYAIARQESAFKSDVKSPAGAIGLMQLMPATAKQTARSIKLPYKNSYELINPDTNIELGSAYLAKMYKRYDNNRVYATAAYNAGPHRVSTWLKQRGNLPIDIWIETIPFDETRQYVQNVLSYVVIYSDKLGKELEFMTDKERKSLLPITAIGSTGLDRGKAVRN